MAQFLTPALMQLMQSDASPYSGGKLYIYQTGTTTELDLFSDEALSVAAANPLVADASGIFPDVYIAEEKFKAVFKDSSDVTIKTVDPAYSIGLISGTSAANVSFDGSGIGFAADDVQEAIVEMDGVKIDYAENTTANMSFVLDEDDMSSDSATKLATQQSIKAYADTEIASNTALFQADLLHVQDVAASGTDGATLTNETWNTRALDTVKTNEITDASLATNRISLPAGTYFVMGWGSYFTQWDESGSNIPGSVLRMRDVTNNTTLARSPHVAMGHGSTATDIGGGGAIMNLCGRFTLAGTANVELQHYPDNSSGLTIRAGKAADTGEQEVYADILIWKVA